MHCFWFHFLISTSFDVFLLFFSCLSDFYLLYLPISVACFLSFASSVVAPSFFVYVCVVPQIESLRPGIERQSGLPLSAPDNDSHCNDFKAGGSDAVLRSEASANPVMRKMIYVVSCVHQYILAGASINTEKLGIILSFFLNFHFSFLQLFLCSKMNVLWTVLGT